MQLHDLCECYSSTNDQGKRVERHVATLYYNLPYSLQKAKKRLAESDLKYPRGTFFVITKNGVKPALNKHLNQKTL